MSQQTFVAAVEQQLPRGRALLPRASLQAFVAASWRFIRDDPDPAHWARLFLETYGLAAPGPRRR